MDQITFDILKIVISICTALITVYAVPYLKTLRQDKRYASLIDMVEVAVKAAEQTIKGKGEGDLKKAEVIAFVSDWMEEHGIKISQDQLSQLVEASGFQLKQEAV